MICKKQRSTEEEYPFDSIAEFIDFFRDKNWPEFVLHRPLLEVSRSQRFAQSVWKRWLNEKKRREKQEEINEARRRKAEAFIQEPLKNQKNVPAEPRQELREKWKFK